jgi:hypothetical protein
MEYSKFLLNLHLAVVFLLDIGKGLGNVCIIGQGGQPFSVIGRIDIP